MSEYKPVKKVKTLKVNVRDLTYSVHTWGDSKGTPVFLLHGFLDTGLSFQFVADFLPADWYLIAPDWRGFGDSDWSSEGYWFPDYLADLDQLLDVFAEDRQVRLVGHSMGGNIVCLYSGICSHRVSHLVSLDVTGLPDSDPANAPERYSKWLIQIREGTAYSQYQDLQQLVRHISKLAPGISESHATFIAQSWSKRTAQGTYTVKADPAHKRVNPVLYRREEARNCWRKVMAKNMIVFGEESRFYQDYYENGYKQDFRECFASLHEESIPEAGHMLHLQQPEKLAKLLDEFLRS